MAPARATRAQTRAQKHAVDDNSLSASSPTKPKATPRTPIPPHTQEIIVNSPLSPQDPSQDRRHSPWRLKVTLEAEEYNPDQSALTTKVPLNDANGAQPKKPARTRPRKRKLNDADDAEAQLITDLSRVDSTPASAKKPMRRKRDSDAGTTPGARKAARKSPVKSPAKTDVSTASKPLRKRIDFSQLHSAATGPTPTAELVEQAQVAPSPEAATEDAEAPATEELEFQQIEREAEAEAAVEQTMEQVDQVEYDDDDGQEEAEADEDHDNSTIALDRSLAESEEFTMVSLESLRQQKAADNATLGNENVSYHEDQDKPQQTSEKETHAEASQNNSQTPRLSKSPSVPPSLHSSPQRRSISRQSPAAVEAGVALQKAVSKQSGNLVGTNPFDGFGTGTRRDLRHGLMIGELLSQREQQQQQQQSQSNGPSSTSADSQGWSIPSASAEGRLPTPEDSNQASDSPKERNYDAMSWKPTTLPRQVGSTRSYDSTRDSGIRPQSRLAHHRDFDENDSMDIDSLRQPASAYATAVALPSKSLLQAPTSSQNGTAANTEPGNQIPAPRSIIPFNNNAESPIPSLRDIVPADDRPTRGKLPRTWRRVSGETSFLYSDETESPQMQPRKAAFNSPGAFFEDMASKVPSIFRRWSNLATPDQSEAQSAPKKRVSDPTPERNVLRSILSSPQRRASSPAKGVHWRPDKDLEDITDHPARGEENLSNTSDSSSSELGPHNDGEIPTTDDSMVDNTGEGVNRENGRIEHLEDTTIGTLSTYPSSPPISRSLSPRSNLLQNPSVQVTTDTTPYEQDSVVDSSEVRSIKRSLASIMSSDASYEPPAKKAASKKPTPKKRAPKKPDSKDPTLQKPSRKRVQAQHLARKSAPVGKRLKMAANAPVEDDRQIYIINDDDDDNNNGGSGRVVNNGDDNGDKNNAGNHEDDVNGIDGGDNNNDEADAADEEDDYVPRPDPPLPQPVRNSGARPDADAQRPEPEQPDELREFTSELFRQVRNEKRAAIAQREERESQMHPRSNAERKMLRPKSRRRQPVEVDHGPFTWTPNHDIHLSHTFCDYLHKHGIRYGSKLVRWNGPSKLHTAADEPLARMPDVLRTSIGRDLTFERFCEKHPHKPTYLGALKTAAGSLAAPASATATPSNAYTPADPFQLRGKECRGCCPGQNPALRTYTHTFTETDARIAWAFVNDLRDRGVPLFFWQCSREFVAATSAAGHYISATPGHAVFFAAASKDPARSPWLNGGVWRAPGQLCLAREDWLVRPRKHAFEPGWPTAGNMIATQMSFVMAKVAHMWARSALNLPPGVYGEYSP